MYPDSNNLHGDHYGFGQTNVNPNSSLTNAPKGQSISSLLQTNNGLNTDSLGGGISSGGINNIENNSNTINDHNVFMKVNNMAVSEENAVIPKESGNVKLVFVIGIILLILIVIAVLCVLFLK